MARPRESGERDGTVVFTHLFSAPLIECKKITGKTVAEKVDELSYQGERDTLLKTLANAGKKVRFLSEAANTESFRRSVGCSSSHDRSYSGHGGGNVGRRSGGILDRYNSRGRNETGCCRDGLRRIVHFTGHGVPGQLTFEDKRGQLQYVDEENLLDMLRCQSTGFLPRAWTERESSGYTAAGTGYRSRRGRSNPSVPQSGLQFVFLSSCHSESVAECFIQAGVPHVVAVRHDSKVLDHKAADFAESIYASLLRGDTVRQAFALSSARVGASDRPEEGHRFLLLPLDGNHDVPVFKEVPAGRFVNETPPEPTYRLDAVTEHFWGRAVDVQKVVGLMANETRCVTITGQKGIGKTQVLLKACAYMRERHVFQDIFFCRVDKAGLRNDACQWLEKGFQLPIGSLSAHNMEGAVAKITAHLQGLSARSSRGDRSRTPQRVLLVLDGCTGQVLVGQERVELKELLRRLFSELPNLMAAVTMRAASPTVLGSVGIPGEEVVVVEGLDDISTAKLFTMCCPRRLQIREMDPNNEAETMTDGKLDTLGVFAKGDIIRALRGHPSCVEDLCRLVHEENSLLVRKQSILDNDIPKIQAEYAYETPRQPPVVYRMPKIRAPGEDADDALTSFWAEVSGSPIQLGFYSSPGSQNTGAIEWGKLCLGMKRWFRKWVPGARNRPLEAKDLALFAEDPALWDKPCPAIIAQNTGVDVAAVLISRRRFKRFWLWFWKAIGTLYATGAWTAGEDVGIRCFAGFLSSSMANSLLNAAEPGTFLIRFSTSKHATLVVQYTSKYREVNKVAIDVLKTGHVTCSVGSGNPRTYRSLVSMALRLNQLTYLHPDLPKHEAFHMPQRRSTMPAGVRSHELSVR